MDIHLLRDGKQIGPFSEETVQSLLKQGNILINDMAWRPGMSDWLPLHAVLYPAAQPRSQQPPPPPNGAAPPMPEPVLVFAEEVPAAYPEVATVVAELATTRQKAFLTYLCIPFTADLTKEKAAMLANDAMENPKHSSRVKNWDEERLRMYPDLFADEIKARRENRSQKYLEICHTEGAEFFEGITKAHTQLLVGYLDVQYPAWEHSEHAAKFDYFFPAIAEKFPQQLKKSAKGRFKYPAGPKVAAELVRGATVVRAQPKKSTVAAMARGLFFGLIVLALVVGAMEVEKRGGIEKLLARLKAAPAPAKPKPAVSNAGTSGSTVSGQSLNGIDPSAPTVASNGSTGAKATEPRIMSTTPATPVAAATNPATAPAVADSSMTAPAPEDPPMTASTEPAASTSVSLFDTTPPPATPPAATADPVASATATATPAPAAPSRMMARITKPTVVNLRFGSSTLRPGTPIQVVAANGTSLTIKFGPETVTIPAANTDFSPSGATAALPQ